MSFSVLNMTVKPVLMVKQSASSTSGIPTDWTVLTFQWNWGRTN